MTRVLLPPGSSAASLASPASQLNNGLIGAWALQEGAGRVVQDAGPYDQVSTGVLNTVGWGSSPFGPALKVGGASPSGITIPRRGANPFSVLNCAASVGAWVYLTTLTAIAVNATLPVMSNFFSTGELNDDNDTWGLGCTSAGNLIYTWNGGLHETNVFTASTLQLTANAWHFVGLVTRGGADRTYYLDGKWVNDTADLGTRAGNAIGTGNPYCLGFGYEATGTKQIGMTGLLGPVYIWNRALTTQEMQQVYVDPYAPISPKKRIWPVSLSVVAQKAGRTVVLQSIKRASSW